MSDPKTLDLAAVLNRDDVKMPNGQVYELRNQHEFGVLDDYRLRALIDQITKLNATATKSEEDAEKASKLIRDLAAMIVVDAPADLDDWVCVAVFQFWVERANDSVHVVPPTPSPSKPRRTTAVSSRGSKPSTAAIRKRGSTPRPGR